MLNVRYIEVCWVANVICRQIQLVREPDKHHGANESFLSSSKVLKNNTMCLHIEPKFETRDIFF